MIAADQIVLMPCPFCGNEIEAKWRRLNPMARCITQGCKGSQLPALNLDMPDDIDAWNVRAKSELSSRRVMSDQISREEADIVECAKLLKCLIESIQAKGHFSIDTTVLILDSALACLPLSIRNDMMAQMNVEDKKP